MLPYPGLRRGSQGNHIQEVGSRLECLGFGVKDLKFRFRVKGSPAVLVDAGGESHDRPVLLQTISSHRQRKALIMTWMVPYSLGKPYKVYPEPKTRNPQRNCKSPRVNPTWSFTPYPFFYDAKLRL